MPEPKKRELFEGEGVIRFDKEVDRRNFLKYAGMVGVGSTLALAGVACASDDDTSTRPTPRGTESPEPEGDLAILNYALTLEYLEADFYKQGLAGNLLSGRERSLVEPIGAHEQAHVDALTATINDLGGTPVAEPTFQYPNGTFTNKDTFLETASTFEELGVTAYYGQVTLIESPEILSAAASIAGVESRHAAVIATLTGGDPFPATVEATKTMDEVLAAAKPFIES
ncbi:hypothetical protein BH23ACT12_BH23ACT12_10600 [soil metagenome]